MVEGCKVCKNDRGEHHPKKPNMYKRLQLLDMEPSTQMCLLIFNSCVLPFNNFRVPRLKYLFLSLCLCISKKQQTKN